MQTNGYLRGGMQLRNGGGTDAEIVSNKAGVSGREVGKGLSVYLGDNAINTLKYYMFPMKALREDVLNFKGRNKVPKK